MSKFKELLVELNFYDYSVGIFPKDTTQAACEVLEEFNISPSTITNEYIVFTDDEQYYKMYYKDEQWIIENHFNAAKVKSQVLQLLSDLNSDEKALEFFGQLFSGLQNFIRLEKNKKYNTYYIDMYIGNNRLLFNGEFSEVATTIKKWFATL